MFSANTTQAGDERGYKLYNTGFAATNVTSNARTSSSFTGVPALYDAEISEISHSSSCAAGVAFITSDGRLFINGNYSTIISANAIEIKVPGKTFAKCAVSQSLWTNGTGITQSGAAITTDGNLYTWGTNEHGQLGVGTQSAATNTLSPVQVGANGEWDYTDDAPVVGGSGIYPTFFAKKSAGTWWAWGWNGYGGLGQNNQINYSSPVQLGGSWKQIRTTFQYDVFGIKTDGSLWFWGYSTDGSGGQGIGTPYAKSSPTQIGALTDWSEIRSMGYGQRAPFATKTDGTMWMWGYLDTVNGVTVGSTYRRSSPVQFGSLTTWAKPVLSQNYDKHSASAIKTDGTLWCWGEGTFNSLYNNTNVSDTTQRTSSPIQVSGISNAVQVAYFSYSIGGDPAYYYYGGLIKTSNNSNKDAYVVGSASSTSNIFGNLPVFRKSFGSIALTPRFKNAAVTSVAFFGTKYDGTLWTSGTPSYAFGNTYPPVQVGTGSNWGQTVSVGDAPTFHNIKTDGTLWGWGLGTSGQVGHSASTNVFSSAVQIGALTTWTKVDGSTFRAATRSDGTMWVWGYNLFYGFLGLGDKTNRNSPTQLGALTNWTTNFAVGYDYTLALKSDNSLWGWGRNTYGAWGTTPQNRSSPVQIAASSAYDKFTAGYEISLFRKPNGTLWVSGNGFSYGLGNGTNTYASSPVQIGTGTDWDTPFTNFQTCFCTKTDGSLWGWGRNDYGQLGLGYSTVVNSPVQISTGVAGSNNSFSPDLNGSLYTGNTVLNSK